MFKLEQVKLIKPVALDVYSTKGMTSLHAAISRNLLNIAEMLIDAGADVNLPLAMADEDVRKLSLQQQQASRSQGGAMDDIFQICGSGALIEACKLKNAAFVQYLLDKGALDHENRALKICCIQNADDLIRLLLSKRHAHDTIDNEVNDFAGFEGCSPILNFASTKNTLNWTTPT